MNSVRSDLLALAGPAIVLSASALAAEHAGSQDGDLEVVAAEVVKLLGAGEGRISRTTQAVNAGRRRNAPVTTRQQGEWKPPRQAPAPAVGQVQRQLTRPVFRQNRERSEARACEP